MIRSAAFALAAASLLVATPRAAESIDHRGIIQTAPLAPTQPYFIPTHPRVTTTIRFPGEIGAPDGAVAVFTEDAEKHPAEYLVGWQPGEDYFTITPLQDPKLANLNVPFQGRTYVFYFYPVPDQLKAVASVTLQPTTPSVPVERGATAPADSAAIHRDTVPPRSEIVTATPARLLGFLDRLKLLHATPAGDALTRLGRTMGLEVASFEAEVPTTGADAPSAAVAAPVENAAVPYELVLVRVVRDPRMNCLGFICVIRNLSARALTFDVRSFGARAGGEYLRQRISDATPVLPPRAEAPAYFVVQPRRTDPLLATNRWHISVDLIDATAAHADAAGEPRS